MEPIVGSGKYTYPVDRSGSVRRPGSMSAPVRFPSTRRTGSTASTATPSILL